MSGARRDSLCFSLPAIPDLSHVVCLLKSRSLGEYGSISEVLSKLSFLRWETTANNDRQAGAQPEILR